MTEELPRYTASPYAGRITAVESDRVLFEGAHGEIRTAPREGELASLPLSAGMYLLVYEADGFMTAVSAEHFKRFHVARRDDAPDIAQIVNTAAAAVSRGIMDAFLAGNRLRGASEQPRSTT